MALFQREMAKRTVTFRHRDQEQRRERAEDAERLRTRQVTASALQAENSILPAGNWANHDACEAADEFLR